MKGIILGLLLLALPVRAEMSQEQWVAEGIFAALLIVDCRQTAQIRHQEAMYEQNPMFGRRPHEGRVWGVCALDMVGHTVISYQLPEQYKAPWQWGTIGVEVGFIHHNVRIGLRVGF